MIPGRIGLALSLALFGVPALVLYLTTHGVIPLLLARGWEPLLAWFMAGGLVFAPLLVLSFACAAIATGSRDPWIILTHLRIRRLSAGEWRLTLGVLAAVIAATGLLFAILSALWPGFSPHPPFMQAKALEPSQYYILAIWLVFFAFNIVGEEAWWRGFIQPRQEPVFGANTWIVQGLLHGLFHVSFGAGVMLLTVPAIFAIPWAVQRTKNTTAGIVVHAGLNGPGFLAVSLGLLPA